MFEFSEGNVVPKTLSDYATDDITGNMAMERPRAPCLVSRCPGPVGAIRAS